MVWWNGVWGESVLSERKVVVCSPNLMIHFPIPTKLTHTPPPCTEIQAMRQLSDYGWTAHDITTSSGDEYYNSGFSMGGFALLLLVVVFLNTNRLFVNNLPTQSIGITFARNQNIRRSFMR